MIHNADLLKFTIYKLVTEDGIYAAVPKEYVKQIEDAKYFGYY